MSATKQVTKIVASALHVEYFEEDCKILDSKMTMVSAQQKIDTAVEKATAQPNIVLKVAQKERPKLTKTALKEIQNFKELETVLTKHDRVAEELKPLAQAVRDAKKSAVSKMKREDYIIHVEGLNVENSELRKNQIRTELGRTVSVKQH